MWERIRLGMKITQPSPLPAPPSAHTAPRAAATTSNINIHQAANPASAQPIKAKYINPPHTAVPPMHNYTELGRRIRFGANATQATDNCVPPMEKPAQLIEPKSTGMSSFPHKLNRRTVSSTPANDTPYIPASIPPTAPCAQHRLDSGKQKQHTDNVAQSNPKNTLINERINKQIAFFSQNAEYLYQTAERARPYLYHIVERLSTNQLPLELALLPMMESAYQPTALSPKGAAGLWQFISSTGKDYDLKQNKEYDGRLDILASTEAAIRFLSDLHTHFNGDWLLALAAYNCGQGTVDNAIIRNISDGLDTDYWSLRLPQETQDYVPRFLALSAIFAKPGSYGFQFTPIKNEPYFVTVKIDREPDIKYLSNKNLTVLARLLNLNHDQFRRLNPGYLNATLSADRDYTFLLPPANAGQLHRLLTSIAQFMAEPVSKVMKGTLKTNSPNIIDLNTPILTTIKL